MQHQAPIVLTGMQAEHCAAFGQACSAAGVPSVHRPADVVLAAPAAVVEDAVPWVFWLYRAPWQVQAGVQSGDGWLALQRKLLRQRPAFGSRLVLINVDADQPHSVLAALGWTVEGVVAPSAPAAALDGDADLSALLAKTFDWAAPEYWDVFEALEAAAPATGRLPLFRSALQLPDAEQVSVLQSLVLAGLQVPAWQAASAVAQQALVQGEAERDALARELHELRAESSHHMAGLQADLAARDALIAEVKAQAAELQGRNESQLLQMHQVQEELEQVFLAKRQQAADADKAQAEQAAQLAGLRTQLQQQADKLGAGVAELAKEVQARQALQGELGRLQPELAAAQAQGQKLAAELKSRDELLKQAQAAAAKVQADLGARAESLQQAQAAQQKLKQDLQAKTSALAAAQQLGEQGTAKAAELERENELLLLQMHQVQEELEQVFLAKRKQAADADKAQAEQAAQLAGLRTQLKQQADKLGAGVAELAKEVQARQALQGELGRLKPELAAAQAQGQKLAAELKSRDELLKQAQAAAAKVQADLGARAESLQQAQAAQQQLKQDLQAKTSALAAAQQLGEQGTAKAAELERENELLLLQLHQVQEELEQFFLESRQQQRVMGQSSQSLDRARRMISRLMLPERETSLPVLTKARATAGTGPAAPVVEATKAA